MGKFGAIRAQKICEEMASNRFEQIVVKGHKKQGDVTIWFIFLFTLKLSIHKACTL